MTIAEFDNYHKVTIASLRCMTAFRTINNIIYGKLHKGYVDMSTGQILPENAFKDNELVVYEGRLGIKQH